MLLRTSDAIRRLNPNLFFGDTQGDDTNTNE